MTEPQNPELAFDDDPAGGDIKAMARHQFNASVVAGLALLGVAAFLMVRAPHVAPTETNALHKVIQPEAPLRDLAQPNVGEKSRGWQRDRCIRG